MTAADDSRIFATLSPMLDEAQSLLARLDALSKRQGEFIDDGAPERLLGLLEERQVVIDRLSEIIAAADPLRARLERAPGASTAQKQSVRDRLNAISEGVGWISLRDKKDGERLQQRRDDIAGQLAGLGASRTAHAAYGSARPAGPRFQDKQA